MVNKKTFPSFQVSKVDFAISALCTKRRITPPDSIDSAILACSEFKPNTVSEPRPLSSKFRLLWVWSKLNF